MALAPSARLLTRVERPIVCLCTTPEPAIRFLLRLNETLCHVFLLLKSYLTSQLLQNVVSVNTTPELHVMAELLVANNHSYREDRAMMTLIQLMAEKWKTILKFYRDRMDSGHSAYTEADHNYYLRVTRKS